MKFWLTVMKISESTPCFAFIVETGDNPTKKEFHDIFEKSPYSEYFNIDDYTTNSIMLLLMYDKVEDLPDWNVAVYEQIANDDSVSLPTFSEIQWIEPDAVEI